MDRERGHLPGKVKTQSDAIRLKLLTLGDPGVGKSCLIKSFCEKRFVPEYIPTIGIDYGVKSHTLSLDGDNVVDSELNGDVPRVELKVNFWDTSGDSSFLEIRNEFYRDTNGVLLVYDISRRESFVNVTKWMKEFETYVAAKQATGDITVGDRVATPVVLLVGNKVDAPVRQVTEEQGREFALKEGFAFFETSALSGRNVELLFQTVFQRMAKNQLNNASKG